MCACACRYLEMDLRDGELRMRTSTLLPDDEMEARKVAPAFYAQVRDMARRFTVAINQVRALQKISEDDPSRVTCGMIAAMVKEQDSLLERLAA
ncbi:hypothetical protein EON67_10210 [archaeon]|nr:MAG: hypothetical protein EON67_10210 [archaeon]